MQDEVSQEAREAEVTQAKELIEVLEPFAAMAAAYDPVDGDDALWAFAARPTIGQLRRARKLLVALKELSR